MKGKKNKINPYDGTSLPEAGLPGRGDDPARQNRYGDSPIGDPSAGGPDDSGGNNMLWIAPPVPMPSPEGHEEGRWDVY